MTIQHCHCGRILPHAHTPECEKPRVRLPNYDSTAVSTPAPRPCHTGRHWLIGEQTCECSGFNGDGKHG